MRTQVSVSGSHVTSTRNPEARICINKGRIKIYNNLNVYLKDGDEFQLELYNPTSERIVAFIEMNNKKISQRGIVLRPGERAFLDRFIDEPKKFKFETYVVSNTQQNQDAVANNGNIKVSFHTERQYNQNYTYTISSPTWTINNGTGNGWYGTTTNSNFATSTYTSTSSAIIGSASAFFGAAVANGISDKVYGSAGLAPQMKKSKLETGEVIKGEKSDQDLKETHGDFNWWASTIIEYKILPISQKMVETKDIKRYCSECGTKAKENHKFCANCGEKL